LSKTAKSVAEVLRIRCQILAPFVVLDLTEVYFRISQLPGINRTPVTKFQQNRAMR